MHSQMDNEITAMLAELRGQQEEMTAAFAKMREVTAVARSKDRMLEASVDAHGRLTGLVFKGQRWRDLAPKELAAKLVEVVTQAQDNAADEVAGLVAAASPAEVDFRQLRDHGPDFDSLLTKAFEDIRKWER